MHTIVYSNKTIFTECSHFFLSQYSLILDTSVLKKTSRGNQTHFCEIHNVDCFKYIPASQILIIAIIISLSPCPFWMKIYVISKYIHKSRLNLNIKYILIINKLYKYT